MASSSNTFIDLTEDEDFGRIMSADEPIDLTGPDSPTLQPQNGSTYPPLRPQNYLSYSPPPEPRDTALKPESIPPEIPRSVKKSLPIQAKSSSARSSPIEKSRPPRTSLDNTEVLLPQAKFAPPPASRVQIDRTQVLPSQDLGARSFPLKQRVIVEDVEDDDDDSPGDGDTTLKRPSRGDPSPQKSYDLSFGTDSPLIQKKKPRIDNEDSRPRRVDSPREVMMRRSISTDQNSHVQQPNIVELEESLEELQQRVYDDHAETVKWLLHDARRATANTKSAFTNRDSPFAQMTPVNAPPGPAPDGMAKLKVDTLLNKKKLAKSSIHLLMTKVASNVPRVPKYSSHTVVKRNILCADDEQLKFMPFLGDSKGDVKASVHNRLVKELDEVYSAKRSGSSSDSELASKLDTYLDGWLEELNLTIDRQALIRYILEEDSDSLGRSQREIRLLRKASGGPLSENLAEVAAKFSEVFKTVFHPVSVSAVILSDRSLKEMLEKANKPGADSSFGRSQSDSPKSQNSGAEHTTERLGTFTNLTCLICGAITCQTHGGYNRSEVHNSDDSEMSDLDEAPAEECRYNHQPVALHYDEILRKQDGRLSKDFPATDLPGSDSEESPCSDECYRTFDYHGKAAELSREDIVALKSFMISMRPKPHPCNISFLLDVPCWQVHTKIREIKSVVPTILEPPQLGRSRGIDWYDNKRKTLRSDWQDFTSAHLHQERTQANPCAHDGPCNGDCPCASSNILCEFFCGCSDDCRRKFTGCNCHASGNACFSDACICIAMNRECGPQCTSCGAVPRIDPKNKYDDDIFTRGCQNIVLQRGVDRKLMIGESQLEGVGFGLYLGEPVQKGAYLSEYAGEVISFTEADRRGIIYDRKYLSFLFDLNSEWCIDAARLGNKTRFINHADSADNGLNCEAKIVLVNGEHRIKFVALRDIAVGEELLFNYGKKFAEKHGLSKKLPKAAKEGGKKGVVVGEEALQALDGNRARGRWTATRGGHASGRGGRKATKSAPMKSMKPMRDLVAEVEKADEEDETMLDVDQVEEDDDEDEDEENVHEGRRKRKIRRPQRYTR